MPNNIAFCRSLEEGKRGKDVIGHKRALSRAAPELYPWVEFTDYFGPRFREALKTWQRRHLMDVTGRIGRVTHEALEDATNKHGEPAFDSLAAKLCADFCDEFTYTVREKIVDAAFYWYTQRITILYSQARPFALGIPPWVPTRWDCSGFATGCHYAGGAPDPNGRGYDGNGYTGTLIQHGRRVNTLSQLKPGDLIFYGYTTSAKPGFPIGSPTHVAVYVGQRMVISNGSYPMGYYRFNYRSINHYRSYDID